MPRFFDVGGAAKSFGSTTVLGGVDLSVARGEFVSLLGPSGCGKTTLLRIVAGLLTPDRGAFGSTARTSRGGRRTGAMSVWCFRTMPCSPI